MAVEAGVNVGTGVADVRCKEKSHVVRNSW